MFRPPARIRSAFVLAFCAAASPAPAQTIRFAVFGDYGQSSNTLAVSNRVRAMTPDFICTTGDNTYSTSPTTANWDSAVGQYYYPFIQLPAASAFFSQGSPVNRFFPTMGNHDWDVGNSAASYTGYFINLPGNRRYYTFTQGPVQFFMVSSDPREPDGVTVGSVQYDWLAQQLAQSAARWQIVMFHHPFQTSTTSGHSPSAYMNWNFQSMGVDMVLQGHNHIMERLSYGGIPWFVTGAGGQSHHAITSISPNSQFRNTTLYGLSLITADANTLTHQFFSAAGNVLDTFTVTQPPACPADADGNSLIQPADVAMFVNTWTASLQNGTLAGDFDNSGIVNPADVAAFVNAWFHALINGC